MRSESLRQFAYPDDPLWRALVRCHQLLDLVFERTAFKVGDLALFYLEVSLSKLGAKYLEKYVI